MVYECVILTVCTMGIDSSVYGCFVAKTIPMLSWLIVQGLRWVKAVKVRLEMAGNASQEMTYSPCDVLRTVNHSIINYLISVEPSLTATL